MKSNIYALKNIIRAALFALAAVIVMSVKTGKAESQNVYLTENQNTVTISTGVASAESAGDEKWVKPTVPVEEAIDPIIEDPLTDLTINLSLDSSSVDPDSEEYTIDQNPTWLDRTVNYQMGETHFAKSIKYPQEAIDKGIQGLVKVFFVVEPDGRATHIKILESLDYECDQAVIQAVHYTKFDPGIVDGKSVKVHCILPVYFSLKNVN